jgi:tRNA(His) 5'-end guanylyltransferase
MVDTLGDYVKGFEKVATGPSIPKGKPMLIRLDGRAFHSFTKGLTKPFDRNLTSLMQATTKYLVHQSNALVGYTQSDEISLVCFIPAESEAEYFFGGRVQKITSLLASMATAYFNKGLSDFLPEKKDSLPLFDARVWEVDSLRDAFLTLLWRERDAIKNSITMVAQYHFGHSKLQGISGKQKREMLHDIGDPWENYDDCFKRGSYFGRVTEKRLLTAEELETIPEKYRPTEPITKSYIKQLTPPYLDTLYSESSDEDILNTIFPGAYQ